jgi:hypothetical protein
VQPEPAKPSPSGQSNLGLGDSIQLVCMDMDGTLLNSDSKITEYTAETIRRCLQLGGLKFLLATGKARPAAIEACNAVGLAGTLPLLALCLCMHWWCSVQRCTCVGGNARYIAGMRAAKLG